MLWLLRYRPDCLNRPCGESSLNLAATVFVNLLATRLLYLSSAILMQFLYNNY